MGTRDDAKLLVPTVRERMRILSPCLLVTLVLFVAGSGPLGIQPPNGWLVATWIPVIVLALLCIPILRRQIPDGAVHLASSASLWCGFAATIIGFVATRDSNYVLILATLLSSAGVLLHRSYAHGTVLVVVAASVPLILRTETPHLALHITMMLTAAGFALLINALMRRAIVRLERLRSTEMEQRRVLAEQLAALERAALERASLQEQLLHAQRLEAVGTLAAGVAHEMNNVLASIGGLASLASELSTDTSICGDLDQIMAQAERGGALTRGLLAFSRRGQYRKRAMHVTEHVEEVVRLLRQTLPKSLRVHAELATDGTSIEADPVQFHQILVNLGLNAADAMNGAGELTIRARTVDVVDGTVPAGRYVELCVIDTGIGMDDATRARIFEPFFTTKPQNKGTGLGLAIVWGIVQAHKGAIEVDSELAKGTTFRIFLPVTERDPTANEIARIPAPKSTSATTILVVDDEELVRSTTQRQLTRFGMNVLTAGNGEEALAVLDRASGVSLVILDMKMPVMGGAECFRLIRERCDVPVLIATGYAADVDAQQIVAAGAALIEKPYSTASLRAEITRLLGP